MFAIVPIFVESNRDDDLGGNLHIAVIFLCTVSTVNFCGRALIKIMVLHFPYVHLSNSILLGKYRNESGRFVILKTSRSLKDLPGQK
jgi:hypothetical protein